MYRRILAHYSLLTEAVPATETSRKMAEATKRSTSALTAQGNYNRN